MFPTVSLDRIRQARGTKENRMQNKENNRFASRWNAALRLQSRPSTVARRKEEEKLFPAAAHMHRPPEIDNLSLQAVHFLSAVPSFPSRRRSSASILLAQLFVCSRSNRRVTSYLRKWLCARHLRRSRFPLRNGRFFLVLSLYSTQNIAKFNPSSNKLN